MTDKKLVHQLLSDWLLKATEASAYNISKPRTLVQQTKPINCQELDSAEDKQNTADKHKQKIPQTVKAKPVRASFERRSHRSIKSKPLPRSGVHRQSNQTKSERTEYESTTD